MFNLKILDRLFVIEISKMMAAVMAVLTVILLSNRLVRYLSKVSAGELSTDAVLTLVGLNMLTLMIRILPAAILVSILLVLGRMYRDNEMSALFSAGVGYKRIYRSVALFVVPIFFLTTFLSLQAMPWLMKNIEMVKATDQSNLDIRGLAQGRFNEYSKGDLVFYVEKISDDDQMENVFIQNRQHGKLGITSSKGGQIRVDPVTGDRFIVLKDGNRYEGVPGQADYKVTKFKEYAVRVAENKEVALDLGYKEMPTLKLLRLKAGYAVSELQKRLSLPISLLIFAVLAVPISRVSPRAGMYGNMLTALLIYIVYENLMSISHSWLIKGNISPWLGVWWVHAGMLLLALFMLMKTLGFAWVKKQVISK